MRGAIYTAELANRRRALTVVCAVFRPIHEWTPTQHRLNITQQVEWRANGGPTDPLGA